MQIDEIVPNSTAADGRNAAKTMLRELTDGNSLDLTLPDGRQKKRSQLIGGAIAFFTIVVVVTFILPIVFSERERAVIEELDKRLDAIAEGKVRVIETWIDGIGSLSNRFAASEYVRLFTYETALSAQDQNLRQPLAEQRPYIQHVVDDFAQSDGLISAALVDASGTVLAASEGFSTSAGDQAALLLARLSDPDHSNAEPTSRVIGNLRIENDNPVFEFLTSVQAPQSVGPTAASAITGALVMTVDATSQIERLLRTDSLSDPGERHWLLFETDITSGQSFAPEKQATSAGSLSALYLNNGDVESHIVSNRFLFDSETATKPTGFASDNTIESRYSFDDRPVFSSIGSVGNPLWHIVSEIDRELALAPVAEFKAGAWMIAGSLTGFVGFVLLSLWWRQAGQHSAAMAAQYRELAERINGHKQLLERITSAIPDGIWLKESNGSIVWANDSLQRFSSSAPTASNEATEKDIFGASATPLMIRSDKIAISRGEARLDEQEIMLRGERRIINFAKMPLYNAAGEPTGLVGIARDVTDVVALRKRRETLIRQTVNSLVHAVELVDPYLLGHTRRVQELCCDIADHMDRIDDERQTLELAAGLSQIGKIFIPRDVLTKPERHTDEEITIMKTHIDHAIAVVQDVDFELPVLETLSQMYERLDGTGYPNRLSGRDISVLARILSVADVFCARTSPRSYRDVLRPADIIAQLKLNHQRYDASVVLALEASIEDREQAIVHSPSVHAGPPEFARRD